MKTSSGSHVAADLHSAIEACGYFPALVEDAITATVGAEPLRHFLVHHEPTFSQDEIHRHLTILALTPSRLIVGHTDEGPASPESGNGGDLQAVSSTESIGLNRINTVAVTRVIANPANYDRANPVLPETWLSVGWGTMRRIELEPASCADPECMGDHGLAGNLVADDLTVRMSAAADGEESVRRLVAFGTELQLVTGQRGGSEQR